MMLPAFKSKKGFTFLRSKKAKPVLKSFLPSAKSSTGFTLIELLIVIAIIGILISIGLAAFSRAQTQARDGERKADIEQIRGALEQYYSDYNVYPPTSAGLKGAPDGQIYLKAVPLDPNNDSYAYNPTGTNQGYCIEVDLEIAPPATPTPPTCGATLNYGLTALD